MHPKPAAAALLPLLLAAAPARAGLLIEAEANGTPSVLSLEGKKLRIESKRQGKAADAEVVLFDGDAHVVYQLDPVHGTYRQLDEATARTIGARMQAAVAEARARMTPEQRKQLDQALQQQGTGAGGAAEEDADTRWEPTGGSEVVAGHRCERYRVLRGGKTEEEACVIPWSAGVATRADLAPFQEMGRMSELWVRSMNAAAGRPAPAGRIPTVASTLEQAPGLPVVMEQIEGDQRKLEWRVSRITRTSIPADRFRVPAGMKRIDPLQGTAE